MLRLEALTAGYGNSRVLHELALDMEDHRIVALLGRNGVGKSTTLAAIMQLVRIFGGRVLLDGEDLTRLPPRLAARRGIGYVPQGRRIFSEFTVMENLRIGTPNGRIRPERLAWIFDLFPRLKERWQQPGGSLSGGEQQMLAIGRALALEPSLLLMDEPMEGLSPAMIDVVRRTIVAVRDVGVRILLVEQNIGNALAMADEIKIMEKGTIKARGTPQELSGNPDIIERYLGVRTRAPARPGGREERGE